MNRVDFKIAFKNAGVDEIPNSHMRMRTTSILFKMSVAAMQHVDWKPQKAEDREFTQTAEFRSLYSKVTSELFKQQWKQDKANTAKTTSWLYEVD